MVSRSPAEPNSIIPPTENIVSGNTSVCASPALVGLFSDAAGHRRRLWVNASRPPPRPARFVVPSRLTELDTSGFGDQHHPEHCDQRMVPCRNSAGRSMVTAPTAANRPAPALMVA